MLFSLGVLLFFFALGEVLLGKVSENVGGWSQTKGLLFVPPCFSVDPGDHALEETKPTANSGSPRFFCSFRLLIYWKLSKSSKPKVNH